MIAVNAAAFFFPGQPRWTALTEVRLPDKYGQPTGNLDLVLVAQDADGRVVDFGAVEVQAVYISGNVRVPFKEYTADPEGYLTGKHPGKYWVRPDYLSSSRKRLAPQLIYKGGILKTWGKKLAVVIQKNFFATLPELAQVAPEEADIAWMLYDLEYNSEHERYSLVHMDTIYTQFSSALDRITTAEAGAVEDFVRQLQRSIEAKKIDAGRDETLAPDIPVIQNSENAGSGEKL